MMLTTAIAAAPTAITAVRGAYSMYRTHNDLMFCHSVLNGDLTGGSGSMSWIQSPFAAAVTQFGLLAAGTKAFVSLYGADMYNGLSSRVHAGLNHAKKHANLGAEPHQNKMNESELASLQHNRRVFIAGLVSMLLGWLHYQGAAEMRAQMHRDQRNAKKQGELYPQDIERLKHWYEKNSLVAPNQEDTAFEAARNGLYAAHPYYIPGDGDIDGPSYFNLTVGDWSARRTAFNLLLGLMLQINSLLFGGGDGLHNAASVIEGVGLFEILCRALRLYGWAPLYQAMLWIQQRLLAPKRRTRKHI